MIDLSDFDGELWREKTKKENQRKNKLNNKRVNKQSKTL